MYDNVVTLHKTSIEINCIGDAVETRDAGRPVFCRITGCTERDKRMAEARGFQGDYTLLFADQAEYEGELWATLNGVLYEVADTYWHDSSKELRVVISRWQRQ